MSQSPSPDIPAQVSDEQLLERFRHGEQAAFEALMGRYRQELFHFLFRFTGDANTAEDVFQETFLQIYLSADSFDPARRFKPWLFTIAANKARDSIRRAVRRPAAALSAPVSGADEEGQSFMDLMQADLPLPDQALETRELQEAVQKIIAQMPDHLREILLLAYFQKFSYQEIAQMLAIPLGTVKSRLHTAVGLFAQKWKTQNPGGT